MPDEKQTSESPESKLPDVCKGESNKTNKSNNKRNDNKSHLILSEEEGRKAETNPEDEIRCDSNKIFQTITPVFVMSGREPRGQVCHDTGLSGSDSKEHRIRQSYDLPGSGP